MKCHLGRKNLHFYQNFISLIINYLNKNLNFSRKKVAKKFGDGDFLL